MDGYDPHGSDLTFTITSSNPLVTPTLLSDSRSIQFDVEGFGDLVFYLFEQRAPRASERMISLSDLNFYDGIAFHRVIDNFVIQAGDPTGSGSGGSELGDFDDQFDVALQHNRTGLLSMAKTVDDTNDSQFFITEVDPGERPNSEAILRRLDFNHGVFGLLVEGEDVREALSDVPTTSNRPDIPLVMNSVEIFGDQENAVLNIMRRG